MDRLGQIISVVISIMSRAAIAVVKMGFGLIINIKTGENIASDIFWFPIIEADIRSVKLKQMPWLTRTMYSIITDFTVINVKLNIWNALFLALIVWMMTVKALLSKRQVLGTIEFWIKANYSIGKDSLMPNLTNA